MTRKQLMITAALLLVAASAHAATAYLDYETEDGYKYKQCVYDYRGEPFVITIDAHKRCPLTIQVDR